MAESAALLVDEAFPEQPVRQYWVLSVPYPLRFLFASRPSIMGEVLGIVFRCIARHLIKKAEFRRKTALARERDGRPDNVGDGRMSGVRRRPARDSAKSAPTTRPYLERSGGRGAIGSRMTIARVRNTLAESTQNGTPLPPQ